MLVTKQVCSDYGQIRALREVSIEVNYAEIVAIIGPNGAGKTTLLSTISGILRASQGSIWLGGQEITNLAAHRIVRHGISHVPERRQVFDTLSVRDNLLLGAYHRFKNETRKQIERDIGWIIEVFPLLEKRLEHPAATLSGGMQQMLAISRGLMARPRILLLDEPSLGLAPLLVQEIFQVIAKLRSEGTTVLLVEQNARAALRVADRGYVLERGRVALAGDASQLAQNADVQRAYLGRAHSARA